ncbi:MAG: 16S rRNA (cytosine(967)-C(5))-methyltransferase RsmB [Woeseiaceae bacterium]
MSRSAAIRASAALAVADVLQRGRSLDEAQASGLAKLAPEAKPLFMALTFGVLRHYRALEWLLGRLLRKPLGKKAAAAHALLLVGLYELWQMRTAEHAVVSETVNAMQRLKFPAMRGLCNAVLRRFSRERESLLSALSGTVESIRLSHPDWLASTLKQDWPERYPDILEANNERAPMWLRVNTRHSTTADYLAALTDRGIEASSPVDLPGAIKLAKPVDVADLPGFSDGWVSVQDLAPQLVGWLSGVRPGLRVLDACSAPGGKAAHLLELADNELDLTALDIDETRLGRVKETFDRLGLTGRCLAADASKPNDWWDGEPFDLILIDAPCSATGVIRRHPDIKALRRQDDIAALAVRQRDLLAALAPLLASDGCLLYATCSILRAENHEVIARFIEDSPDMRLNNELRNDNIRGLMAPHPQGLQMLPGDQSADGFFVSLMTKTTPE